MQTTIPWTAPQREQLQRARAGDRLPQGLLIHAAPGVGGEELARFAAQLALCRSADAPCGVCRDCRMVAALQHPDLHWIAPIEKSKFIRVEQIRDLSDELALTPHGGGASVAIISPADSMNANAANALLKTLEEPRTGVVLVLVSSTPSRLPATILSRCQRLAVRAPTRAESLAWLVSQRDCADWNAVLEVLGNAPLAALQVDPQELKRLRDETAAALARAKAGELDIPDTAQAWARSESFELRLACVENWLTTRIDTWSSGGGPSAELRNTSNLSESVSELNIGVLLRLLEAVYELKALHNVAVNRALALEQLFWRLARATRGPAVRAAAH